MNQVLLYPHKILRRQSKEISRWGKKEKETAKRLEAVLGEENHGLGLAAPQVGVNRRVFVIKGEVNACSCQNCSRKKFSVFINPQIRKTWGEKVFPATKNEKGEREPFLEGCLSLPGIYGPVRRWLKIKAFWQEPVKKEKKIDLRQCQGVLSGLAAIVFQHELDHLEGVLFIDHVRREGKRLFRFDDQGRRIALDWSVLPAEKR